MRTFRPNKLHYAVFGFVSLVFGIGFLVPGLIQLFGGNAIGSLGFISFGVMSLAIATNLLITGFRYTIVLTEEWLLITKGLGPPLRIHWKDIYNVEEVLPGENWVLRIYVKGRKPITLPDYIDEVGELAQILYAKVEKRIGPKHLR